MSIRAIQAVWDRTETGGSVRLLLLALADFADEDGLAWPSVATLARRVGRNERRIQQLIAAAVEAGELVADRGGGRGTSRYWLAPGGNPVREPERGVQPIAPLGRNGLHPRGAAGDTPGVQRAAPEPSVEPSVEPSGDPARAQPDLDAGAIDPIVRYHELTARFPSERVREWLNDVASSWGDERTANALGEAFARDTTHRGLISRAIDVMNEQEHDRERSKRDASRTAAAEPPKPEQSPEERAAIEERNRASARASRAALLADGRVNPTRPGDEELLQEELERRQGATP